MGLTPAEAMAAAVHDVRSSVGSIRLALTSVLDDDASADADADFRRTMLSNAEQESRRLNAALTALPALVASMTDSSEPSPVDVTEALQEVADAARAREVQVRVGAAERVQATVRVSSLIDVLTALCVVVADAGGDVRVDLIPSPSGGARVRISRADGAGIRWDRALVRSLADSVGAALGGDDTSFEFDLPSA